MRGRCNFDSGFLKTEVTQYVTIFTKDHPSKKGAISENKLYRPTCTNINKPLKRGIPFPNGSNMGDGICLIFLMYSFI